MGAWGDFEGMTGKVITTQLRIVQRVANTAEVLKLMERNLVIVMFTKKCPYQ